MMKKTLALLFLAVATASASDWPQWRGPNRDGISTETDWQTKWSASGPKILWKANVGLGYSSFVVADGKVYTTGFNDGQDTVFCFDAVTGKPAWKHSYPAELGDKFFQGGTTGTPTVSNGQLFHLSRWGDLFCFDAANGKVVWSKNIATETGIRLPDWGYTGAPLIWKNLLILNIGASGIALEKGNGKIVWQSKDKNAGYSTPLPFEQGGKTYVTMGSGRSYVAVNALTGEVLWEFPWTTSYGVNAADPIMKDGLVFVSSGYNKGSALFKPGSSTPEVIWQSRELATQMNPAVLIGDYLYAITGNEDRGGSMKCVEFKTGATKWQEKSVGHGALTGAGDKLIVLTEAGELIVARATPEKFEELSRASVLSGKCWSMPVLANGHIYARNAAGDVVCVDVSK